MASSVKCRAQTANQKSIDLMPIVHSNCAAQDGEYAPPLLLKYLDQAPRFQIAQKAQAVPAEISGEM